MKYIDMVIAGDLPGIVAVHFDDLREIIIYGIKAVWKEGQAVYAMNYMGRVLEDGFSGNFLKEALRAADVKMPSIILQFYV